MLKDKRVIRQVSNLVGTASERVVSNLLKLNKKLKGREEEFTSQLKSEITLHLFDHVKNALDKKVINGVRFEVYTFTKKQENKVGADLLGILQINLNGQSITKAYLAQAKVGEVLKRGKQPGARCYDKRLQKQVADMLKLSSDSFVFIYTESGIFVVPANQVKLSKSNNINTKSYNYRRFGQFYEEFFKCFIGDHKIAPPNIRPEDLPKIARMNKANRILYINASMPK